MKGKISLEQKKKWNLHDQNAFKESHTYAELRIPMLQRLRKSN